MDLLPEYAYMEWGAREPGYRFSPELAFMSYNSTLSMANQGSDLPYLNSN
jgi:hypothetical protein